MSRVVVIGATGHVGGYLVPRLIDAGHDVVAISRGRAEPYRPHRAWQRVERLVLDRAGLEAEGRFGAAIAGLEPDVVIDLICFELDSARQLAEALSGRVAHLLHTGTIWTHGHPVTVPTPEEAPKRPFGEYGVKKAAIEEYLLGRARTSGLPVTVIHPGHIVGTGWVPLNPSGHFNPEVYVTIGRGERLALPNFGLETVHHVHADDVAALFLAAMANRSTSVGESFHAVSEGALTLRGYAEEMYRWFGHEPQLDFLPYADWARSQDETDAAATWEHIARTPNCSMAKARRLLDFRPRYGSLQAVQESVEWLITSGRIQV
ncbi:MAG TPA: NAD(P)-dependent oxidoreductase [Microlunatus sp.]|nr:NAD(P)-dependent oxidoreductase [Microlunatus sp.]